MISKDQIKELLVDIENERVERTISTKDTDKFAKAICAFANDLSNKKLPGYLMVGTHDDGSLNGLKVTDELLRNLAGLRSDGNIQPKPALMVEKVSFPEGDLAVVEFCRAKLHLSNIKVQLTFVLEQEKVKRMRRKIGFSVRKVK
ncbi:MAG: ATP-binding protein [Parabacteroides sp.]|nr:ATP-binding protein [Parabacteroides sp.]